MLSHLSLIHIFLLALESPFIAVPHAENPTVERHYFGYTSIINDLHAVVHAIFQQEASIFSTGNGW